MPRRSLDLGSGGWLLILAGVFVLAAVAWLVRSDRDDSEPVVGDGADPASYGFDLSRLDAPRETFVAAGVAKDEIPALTAPALMPAGELAAFNDEQRGKYLVDSDRVIGVTIDGEARAYPIRVLNWHEVVNDTVGGLPISVTYHPLCGSVVVFERSLGGEELEFGVSGLLDNSNLLLFDRRDDTTRESLWSQLRARAVAGPALAEGARLRVLPASLARWEVWKQAHPDTEVLRPDPRWAKRYRKNPYGNYFLTRKPRFPVAPLPADTDSFMHPLLVIDSPAGPRHFRLTAQQPGPEPPPGLRFVPAPDGEPPSVLISAGAELATRYVSWFAWYAQNRGDFSARSLEATP